MFEILRKDEQAKGSVIRFDISAPKIAAKVQAGQFVIIRVNETGERIPITVADVDPFGGSITIYFQVVGKSTALMRSLKMGDMLRDVVGPLGRPAHIIEHSTVIVVGGGAGVAILHHITKAMRQKDNTIIGIIGAREKDLLILEHEMQDLCDELVVTTDDGSYGIHGFVTQPLKTYLTERPDIALVYAIGPLPMMKNVCKLTAGYEIPTMVSLNPIMIDGTGMCGGCRVQVDGRTQFCCVDGPDFDGHKVDFAELEKRNSMYLKAEKDALLYSIR
jgi:ferredoxin/flavodoxin---NADP+ reductase